MATASAVIAEAKKHIGYKETPKGSNKSIFGKWYGMDGSPWCAMYVSYCMNKGGAGKLIKGAQSAKGYASCGAGIKFFKAKKAWFPVSKAKPGDHVFFDWNKDGSQDHVGLVLKLDLKNKRVLTIEGNTGPSNLSNGGMVSKQWRSFGPIMGVGRPAYDPETPAVAPVKPAVVIEAPKAVNVPPVVETASVGLVSASSTKEELIAYQVKKGLPQTGLFDDATKARLGL